ncbi:MAG: hypothetical protein KIT81_02130 [Alphaproteobacteria bacterium]|nr:hypothetical protein [Alphaproteobacteria bacterium]
MISHNAVRDLRQAAEILRSVDLWDDGVARELRATWSRLERLAELIENQDFEAVCEPAPAEPRSANVVPLARRVAGR